MCHSFERLVPDNVRQVAMDAVIQHHASDDYRFHVGMGVEVTAASKHFRVQQPRAYLETI